MLLTFQVKFDDNNRSRIITQHLVVTAVNSVNRAATKQKRASKLWNRNHRNHSQLQLRLRDQVFRP